MGFYASNLEVRAVYWDMISSLIELCHSEFHREPLSGPHIRFDPIAIRELPRSIDDERLAGTGRPNNLNLPCPHDEERHNVLTWFDKHLARLA
jgi:hypothetical protein